MDWILIVGGLYVLALVYAAYISRKHTRSVRDYIFAGSNIRAVLGFLTFSATLFSTFTLMGLPDFFRLHGVGAWIFLGVTDVAMGFVILWFGLHFRRLVAQRGFRGMAALIADIYGSRWASYVYFAGVFVFLVPYVAIQMRGIAIFLDAAVAHTIPVWVWTMMILAVMLLYSTIGGLRAIIYSDALQGVLLLVVTYIVAYFCIQTVGGIPELFSKVKLANPELLSIPGPKGLFGVQFLVSSFLAIVVMPITQPQLTTRIVIMKDNRQLIRMAVAVSVFSFFVILPTIAIGFYGAVFYGKATAAEFLTGVLLNDQSEFIAALGLVGLVAAAMSTADSQIFALGAEFHATLSKERAQVKERDVEKRTKWMIVVFAFAAFVFSLWSGGQLVLLARISFAGTSLLAPMIVLMMAFRGKPPGWFPLLTGLALFVFLLSAAGILPGAVGPLRMDFLLLFLLSGTAFYLAMSSRQEASDV